MKAGPVTKLGKRNTSKIFDNGVMWAHCDIIVFFPIYGHFADIRKPNSEWMVYKYTLWLIITFHLLFIIALMLLLWLKVFFLPKIGIFLTKTLAPANKLKPFFCIGNLKEMLTFGLVSSKVCIKYSRCPCNKLWRRLECLNI